MGQLAAFTAPVQEPLFDLQHRLSQLCALHRDAQDRLRLQANDLLEGQAGQRFSGMTASQFSDAISQYLQTSEKLMQQIETLEQGARACINNIENAAEAAERGVVNESLVYRVLSEVDLDRLLAFGESIIEDALQIVSAGLHDLLTKGVQGVAEDLLDLPDLRHLLANWGAEVHHAIQVFLGLVEETLSQFGAPVFELAQGVAEQLGGSEKLAETLTKDVLKLLGKPGELKSVLKATKRIPVLDMLTLVPNILIDIHNLKPDEHTPRHIKAAILGNVLQVAVGCIPVAGEVVGGISLAETALQIDAQTRADKLNQLANMAPPGLQKQLLQEAASYQVIAENADKFGETFDDIGLIIIDDMAKHPSPAITRPGIPLIPSLTTLPVDITKILLDPVSNALQGDKQLDQDFNVLGHDLVSAGSAPIQYLWEGWTSPVSNLPIR